MENFGYSTRKEDQSKNGVSVVVTYHYNVNGFGGTTVQADCSCHGTSFRTHSWENCPNRLRLIALRKGQG